MSEPTALEVDYRHQIAQLTKERDQLAAKVAAYRHEISKMGFYCAGTELQAVADYSLKLLASNQCGVGWLQPEKKKVLVEALQLAERHLIAVGTTPTHITIQEIKQALEAAQ